MKRLSVLTAVVVVLLLMVHAGGVSAEGVFPLVSCDPDCAGTTNGDKVVDPTNCTSFYYCTDGVAYGPIPCGAGSIFDSDQGQCVAGDACESICGPGGGDCPLTCNGTVSSIADVFNCSLYYFCIPAGAYPQSCPANFPYYDGNTLTCSNNESVCCRGYCEAYCDGTGVSFVPDPLDCTKFYICDTEEGIPDEEHHFTCHGGYFDVKLGDCVTGTPPDPCPTLCDAATGRKKSGSFSHSGQARD